MTRDESMRRLQVSLSNAINGWMEDVCNEDEWANVGFVSDDTHEAMANAAINVLRYGADLQKSLMEDGAFVDPNAG